MPYTKKENRAINSTEVNDICLDNKGDLTAVIFELQLRYILKHGVGYQVISDTVSAAHDAGVEIERRILAEYEDKCIEKNGDFSQVDRILEAIDEKFCTVEDTFDEAIREGLSEIENGECSELKASEIFDYGSRQKDFITTLTEEEVEKEYLAGFASHNSSVKRGD